MTQFRIGILPLHIEMGRFRNVPEDEKKCKACDFNDIENEFHFIMNLEIYYIRMSQIIIMTFSYE
jgi:hypothetical protein